MQKIKDYAVPSPNWYIYNTNHAPTAQGSLWKDCKHQRNRAFALRSCLLERSEVTPIYVTSVTALTMSRINKNNNSRHANLDGGKFMRLRPYRKNSRQLRSAERGRNCLPQERAQQLVIQYQIISLKNV